MPVSYTHLDVYKRQGLQLPLTALVADLFDGLLATHESADQAAALLALEELNKGIRLGEKPDQF